MNILESLKAQKIIQCDSEVMSGVPVFTGTRVPLQTFYDYLEGESGLTEFLEDFPHLKAPVFQILEFTTRTMLKQERTVSAHSA